MVLVTVVGEHQCRKGLEFVFEGPVADCRDCKVRNVCFHLEPNRRYRITGVRDVHHECRMHEDGVRVVEVERVPARAAIPSRSAIEGSMLSFEGSGCDRLGCPNFRLCVPVGVSEGLRFRVSSVEGQEISCPLGRSLRVVLLE